MLCSEIEEPRHETPSRPSSPIRPGSIAPAVPSTPSRKQVLSVYSPSKTGNATPRNPGQDDPSAAAYMDSPVRKETKDYLESPQKALRVVPKTPYRVLDAPDLTDDFYLNLVDWSSTNILGVGLGSCVYLWSAKTAQVTKLCDLGQHDHITSLNWVNKGSHLAVGTFQGHIQIWDATSCECLRDYTNAHSGRVGALAWYQSTITSGSRDRGVQHRDVRAPDKRAYEEHTVHKQEVCGLKWNVQLGQLASGGNDNKLLVWDHRSSRRKGPLWKFHEHSAAVKAIAWSPHNPGVLVSGGGTQDKKMRFWNTQMGTLLAEVDTGSQVRVKPFNRLLLLVTVGLNTTNSSLGVFALIRFATSSGQKTLKSSYQRMGTAAPRVRTKSASGPTRAWIWLPRFQGTRTAFYI